MLLVANVNKILWRPSRSRVENANITRFMTLVCREHGVAVKTYSDLYRWSVSNTSEFWRLLWQFSGLIAENQGDITLQNADKMSCACWFPNASLNYAENLLAHHQSKHSAIIFQSEHGIRQDLSQIEL